MITNKKELAQCFFNNQKEYWELEQSDLPSNSKEYQERAKSLLMNLVRMNIAVERLGLFSKNEELDDINTEDLKYLIIPYFVSSVYTKIVSDNRLLILKKAMNELTVYLEQMKKLKLIHKNDLYYYENGKFSGDVRSQTIDRHRRKEELSKQVKALTSKIMKLKEKKGIEDIDEDDELEEMNRDHATLMLKQYSISAIEDLKNIKQEIEILEFQEKTDKKELDKLRQEKKETKKPTIYHIPSSLTKLEAQQKILREAFIWRNPPTMSLEEFAQKEMQRLKERQEKEKKLAEQKKEVDPDDEEEIDKETYRQRAWDDWKDDHPKGMGNMKR